MPPAALACAMARSVLMRSSAPSTADEVPLSSSTPIVIGGPLAAWVAEVAPPPHAMAATVLAAATASHLHEARRPCPLDVVPDMMTPSPSPPDTRSGALQLILWSSPRPVPAHL